MADEVAHRFHEAWEPVAPTHEFALSEASKVRVYEKAIKLTRDEFTTFWNLKPNERLENTVFGKTFATPREQKLYASEDVPSYAFSRLVLPAEHVIPDLVQRCIDYSKRLFPEVGFNGALVNWYANGSDYIAPHSDSETDMEKNKPICSFSFGHARTFRITSKKDKNMRLDISTLDGSCIVMMGKMQDEFLHEITKITSKTTIVGPRINVTVRAFIPGDQRPTKKVARSRSESSSSSDSDS